MLRVRALTAEEAEQIKRLAQSRTAAARTVERAQMIWLARQGKTVPMIAQELQVGAETVRLWLKRFNAAGVQGLNDEPRVGRPATYTPEEIGEVIAASLTNPKSLGLPFGSWTLDRLEVYLNEQKGIAIKRSRIDEILVAEGLRWRTQETWFGDRVDPAFAKKRGSSPACIPHLRPEVSS
ncbi:MAG: helix-turn-helix domain-containing protein [Dehalococcoidia bacterium]|nr:helix-turn-helix domain-containing protein [Dehalococcoidia bacterium]